MESIKIKKEIEMKINVNGTVGYYDDEELQNTGMSQICDENDCVFAEIFEDGEIVLFQSSDEDD